MSRYEWPHPRPWYEGGYFEAQIRHRFQVFASAPWFKALVVAYCHFQDRDDEWAAEEILRGIEETAMLRGIAVRPRECSSCDEARLDIDFENFQCNACEEGNEQDLARQKADWEAMTQEERDEALEMLHFMRQGLIARDVQ